LKIIAEINLKKAESASIKQLRNSSFPNAQVDRTYYKQLPHYRCLEYREGLLVGHMGLDYRVVSVAEWPYKILGVIDLCVSENHRGTGIGTAMLAELVNCAKGWDVDFIMLASDLPHFYQRSGFEQVTVVCSWLMLHEHRNHGVATETMDDLYIKSIRGAKWPEGVLDWLGYRF